jgi:alpha-tubulin suppressor-like RCC1 family protein
VVAERWFGVLALVGAVACGGSTNSSSSATGGTAGAGGAAPVPQGGAAGSSEPPHPVVMSGWAQNCARFVDGSLKCWGQNGGWLGLGDTEARGDEPGEMGALLPFVDVGSGVTVDAVSLGDGHTCAVLSDRSVKCWGQNSAGELGLGDTAPRGMVPGELSDDLPPVDLGTGRFALQVVAADGHTCALLDDRSVKCWGNNYAGTLGIGDTVNRGGQSGQMGDALPPVDLGAGVRATAVSARGSHTCALLDDGSVKCWGPNQYGELGLGDLLPRGASPADMGDALPRVDLGTGRTAVAISAGLSHTCAILDNGWLRCWGWNTPGLLGLEDDRDRGGLPGEMGDRLPDVHLGTGRTPILVAAGGYHSCALLDDGSVKCWGTNDRGELGLGDSTRRGTVPGDMGDALPTVDLGTGRHAVWVATGYNHSCAVLDDDSVKCWGDNEGGQLGLGDTVDRGVTPEQLGDGLPPVDL